jgi:hypothetical protein
MSSTALAPIVNSPYKRNAKLTQWDLSISAITLRAAKRAWEGASDGQWVLTVGRRKGGERGWKTRPPPLPPQISKVPGKETVWTITNKLKRKQEKKRDKSCRRGKIVL